MAELNYSPGKSGGRQSLKRMPVRVDLTAMVDLAFLLITFFMLTTSLNKPKVMKVAMPVNGPDGFVPETRTMSICLGKNNQAVWYMGMPDKPLTTPIQTGYGKNLLKAITEQTDKVFKASAGKGIIVLVKPADHSIYDNLVETLDDMSIANVQSYAITKIAPQDIDLLKQKGIY